MISCRIDLTVLDFDESCRLTKTKTVISYKLSNLESSSSLVWFFLLWIPVESIWRYWTLTNLGVWLKLRLVISYKLLVIKNLFVETMLYKALGIKHLWCLCLLNLWQLMIKFISREESEHKIANLSISQIITCRVWNKYQTVANCSSDMNHALQTDFFRVLHLWYCGSNKNYMEKSPQKSQLKVSFMSNLESSQI